MNDDLRALLSRLDPQARNDLRRVLIRDHADRDAAMRYVPRASRLWIARRLSV